MFYLTGVTVALLLRSISNRINRVLNGNKNHFNERKMYMYYRDPSIYNVCVCSLYILILIHVYYIRRN